MPYIIVLVFFGRQLEIVATKKKSKKKAQKEERHIQTCLEKGLSTDNHANTRLIKNLLVLLLYYNCVYPNKFAPTLGSQPDRKASLLLFAF